MKERIEFLEKELPRHQKLYYNGDPEIDDYAYNKLEDELRSLKPDSKVLLKVRSDVNTDNVIKHDVKMLSLHKGHSLEDVLKVQNQIENNKKMICTYKMDGCASKLIYSSGHFMKGAVGGNDSSGDDITRHLQYVKFPKELQDSLLMEIRGEVVLSNDNFILLKKEMVRLKLKEPKSQRNIVAGLLNAERKDNFELCRFLDFVAYDFIDDNYNYNEKLNILKENNFLLPNKCIHYVDNAGDIEALFLMYYTSDKDYLTDGLVFRFVDQKVFKQLGDTDHHPRGAIAWKPKDTEHETTILSIDREVGRTGKISYVANIEPVEVVGATLRRATLHNAKNVIDNKLGVGAKIIVVRSNDILPKFIRTIEPITLNLDLYCSMFCPSCNSQLRWSDTKTDLLCINNNCEEINFKRILHFSQVLEMKGLGESTLRKLYKKGFVEDFTDLFRINSNTFMNLPGFKRKSSDKAYKAIQDNKNMSLVKFFSSLSVDGLGESVSELIVDKFITYENFYKNVDSIEILTIIDGIGNVIAENIIHELIYINNMYNTLIEYGCTIIDQDTKDEEISDGKFKDLCFIISGKIGMGKKEAYKIIKSNGGKKASTVLKADYLITNETSTRKALDAVKYDKKVLSEDEFIKWLGE